MAEPTNPNARARNGLKQLAWDAALREGAFEVPAPHPIYHGVSCVACGEGFVESDEIGEMHDPSNPEERGGIVHAQCGLDRDWVQS